MKIKIVERQLAELKPYENNPRINDDAVEPVAESIRQFGFKVPIIIDGGGVIIAGHTRYRAAHLLELDKVPCIVADDLTPEQIKAFRIADNKTAEFAEWDLELLSAELEELTAFDIDMTAFNFDDEFFAQTDDIDDIGDGIGWQKPTNVHEKSEITLVDRFIVPPFSILDTRQGYWADRVRSWRGMIGDTGQARDDAKMLPAAFVEKYGGRTISLLDPVLSEVVVRWFMPEDGDKCFDVFAGDTVFGFVSSTLGKDFTGIELREEQAAFNNRRTAEKTARYICDDGRNVLNHIKPETQDLLFSCPPYFDIEVYSDMENDASNQPTYKEFYAILDEAFSNAIKCLKNNRFAVIVAGDVRNKKDGTYYGFMDDIKQTFKRNGMELYNELILVNPVGSGGIRAARNMHTRKVVKVHQNVLVFYKGDTSAIKDNFPVIDFPAEEVFDDESENE